MQGAPSGCALIFAAPKTPRGGCEVSAELRACRAAPACLPPPLLGSRQVLSVALIFHFLLVAGFYLEAFEPLREQHDGKKGNSQIAGPCGGCGSASTSLIQPRGCVAAPGADLGSQPSAQHAGCQQLGTSWGRKAAQEALSEAAWGWGRAGVRSLDPVRALGETWCLCSRRVSSVNLCGTRGCCLPGAQLFVLKL